MVFIVNFAGCNTLFALNVVHMGTSRTEVSKTIGTYSAINSIYLFTGYEASPREIVAVLGNIKLAIVRITSDFVFFIRKKTLFVCEVEYFDDKQIRVTGL